MIYIFNRVLIAIALTFIIKEMITLPEILIKKFFERLKILINDDENHLAPKEIKIIDSREKQTILYDPPPYYEFLNQSDLDK